MRVQIYKNLRDGNWSVRHKGKVIDHLREAVLDDVTFVVRESRRQAVIANHCREVHAWAEGELSCGALPYGERTPITYNPYLAPTFTRRDNGAAVHRCEHVHFTASDGAVAIGAILPSQ